MAGLEALWRTGTRLHQRAEWHKGGGVVGEDTADEEILDKGRHVNVGKSGKHPRNSADHLEKSHRNVDISGECGNLADSKPRRSDSLLKRRDLVKKVSCSTTTQQDHTSVLVKEMGGSCSSEFEESKKENKLLKNRIMLYEAGITDSSIHASQTNIGLLNLSSESNNECTCSSNWISIIEVVGILMVTLITVYILYGWCCRYLIY